MVRDCKECVNLGECYPTGGYIEVQLDGQIKRDLCVNNDKVEWKQVDKRN
jgi:hypothetical protein